MAVDNPYPENSPYRPNPRRPQVTYQLPKRDYVGLRGREDYELYRSLGTKERPTMKIYRDNYGLDANWYNQNVPPGRSPINTRFDKAWANLPEEDRQAIATTAEAIDMPAEWLAAVIHQESGGTFDPAIAEIAGGSTATGLIQFLTHDFTDKKGDKRTSPATFVGVGDWGDDWLGKRLALQQMSFAEQMELVRKYYELPHVGWADLPDEIKNSPEGAKYAYSAVHGGNAKAWTKYDPSNADATSGKTTQETVNKWYDSGRIQYAEAADFGPVAPSVRTLTEQDSGEEIPSHEEGEVGEDPAALSDEAFETRYGFPRNEDPQAMRERAVYVATQEEEYTDRLSPRQVRRARKKIPDLREAPYDPLEETIEPYELEEGDIPSKEFAERISQEPIPEPAEEYVPRRTERQIRRLRPDPAPEEGHEHLADEDFETRFGFARGSEEHKQYTQELMEGRKGDEAFEARMGFVRGSPQHRQYQQDLITNRNRDPAVSAIQGIMGDTGEAAAPAAAPAAEETGEAPALRDLRKRYRGARREALPVSGEDIQGGDEAAAQKMAVAAEQAKKELIEGRDKRRERRRMAKGRGVRKAVRGTILDEETEVPAEGEEETSVDSTLDSQRRAVDLGTDEHEVETIDPTIEQKPRIELPQEQAMAPDEEQARIAEIGEAVPTGSTVGDNTLGGFAGDAIGSPAQRAAIAAMRTGTTPPPLSRAAGAVVRQGDEVAELLARNSELVGKFGPGDPARAGLYDELLPKMLKGDLPTKAQDWLDIEDLAGRVDPKQQTQAMRISKAFANTNLDQNERRMLAHYLGNQFANSSPAHVNALIADEQFIKRVAEGADGWRPKYQTWLKNAGADTLKAAGRAVKATVGAPVKLVKSIPGRVTATLGEGLEKAADLAYRRGLLKGLNETDALKAARKGASLLRIGNALKGMAALGSPGPEDLAIVYADAYIRSWKEVAKMQKSPTARTIWQSEAVAKERFPGKGVPPPAQWEDKRTPHPFFTYKGNKLVPNADYTGMVKEFAAVGDRDAVMGTILGLVNDEIWSEELGAQVMRTIDRETGDIEQGPPAPEEAPEAEPQQLAAE